MARERDYRTEYPARVQRGLDRGLSYAAARGHPRKGEPTATALDAVEREAAGGKNASLAAWWQAVEVRTRQDIGPSMRDAADLRESLRKADRQTLKCRGHRRAQGTANPALTGPIAAPEPPKRRWDGLDDEERRRLSAEIARQEALAQGTPPIATPKQHRQIAAIMATAVSMDSGGPDEQR